MKTKMLSISLFSLIILSWLSSCKHENLAPKVDCFEMYLNDDTSATADSCGIVMKDIYRKICLNKYDSLRNAALMNPNSQATLVVDYSYEEGIQTTIIWGEDRIQLLNTASKPGPIHVMDVKTINTVSKIIGRKLDGVEAISADSAKAKNSGSLIRIFTKHNGMTGIRYVSSKDAEYVWLQQVYEAAARTLSSNTAKDSRENKRIAKQILANNSIPC